MIRVTLLLAQGPGKPDGDLDDRLLLDLCLTAQGQIDIAAYESAIEPWLASHDDGGPPRHLEIIRLDDGWALQSTASEDDPICPFEGHIYRPGELVALHRADGEHLLFRIVNTEPV